MPLDLKRYTICQGGKIVPAHRACHAYAEHKELTIPAIRPALIVLERCLWRDETVIYGTIENVLKILNILGESL